MLPGFSKWLDKERAAHAAARWQEHARENGRSIMSYRGGKARRRIVSFRLSAEESETLERICSTAGKTVTEYLREVLGFTSNGFLQKAKFSSGTKKETCCYPLRPTEPTASLATNKSGFSVLGGTERS